MSLPVTARIRITDVSPRDGLQNEHGVIPTADKARLVQLLAASGVDEVEVTSFVSARWIPQLADAAELLQLLSRATPTAGTPAFSALVPNQRGLAALVHANQSTTRPLVSKAAVFTSASETFAKKNTNASIAETIERFIPVIASAHSSHLRVRGYISCAFACPFEGPTPPEAVARVADDLLRIGVDELDVADTIGAATPESTATLLALLRARLGPERFTDPLRFTLHLHDTFGRALDCARVALDLGVRSFDASVAGLGGCPYAGKPGQPAPGNLSTERLVQALLASGFTTGIDPARLAAAADFARAIVERARADTTGTPGAASSSSP